MGARSGRRCGAALVALALGIAGAGPLRAEEPPGIHVPTLAPSPPIALDGVLDEPVWQQAVEIAELTQHEPEPGAPTEFRTRVLLFTDGETLFLAYDCHDPDPAAITVHTLQRDGEVEGDDSVDFVLDTFGDRSTAYWFLVSAGGARADGLVSSTGFSLDWDGIWDAATRRTPSGWSAEVAVPARSLHFRRGTDAWGFNVARQVARRQMILRWTAIPRDADFFDLRRAGTLEGLGAMRQGIGLAVTPFALAAGTRERPAGSETDRRAGADVSYSITPELTGVFTYRTDFAETEVDARQVNLTRFPLFFPEKRAFFLEGANQFDFAYGLEADFIPFFTRRIGLFEGREVPLGAGFKVLGHAGRWSIGALGVRTREAPGAPRRVGLGAARLAWDAGAWRLGTLFTEGDPDGIHDNALAAADALYRSATFRGDKNLVASFWGARSSGDLDPGVREEGAQRGGWGALLAYPNDRWDLSVEVRELGDALDPALGFLPRPGTRWYELGVAYQPRPRADGPWGWARQLFFENFDYLITDLSGRTQSWRIFLAPFNVVTSRGDHFEANVVPYFERLSEPFALGERVSVPPGSYRFDRYRVQAEAATSRRLRPALTVWFGEFYDGHLTQWIPSLGWSSRHGHLRLAANAEVDAAHLRAGDVVNRLYGLRAVYAFTPDLVLSSFTQYDSESRSLGTNNLLRWTIQPGRDLFVVLDHSWGRPTSGGLVPLDDRVSAKLRWTFWW